MQQGAGDSLSSQTEARPATRQLTQPEQRTIIFGLLLSIMLAALDQTIVAPALPTIGAALGDLTQLSWIVTSYLLAATAVTPLYGKLADIHGRRITLNIAIGIFLLGSICCALSPTVFWLVVARALQGLGGGGLIVLAQTTIADAVSPKERARYQGHIASTFASASIAGPLLGGFIAGHLTWTLIFWINLPLGGLALVAMNRALRNLPQQHRRHRLDWLGASLMLCGTVSLLLGLTWGGVRFPWASATIVSLLIMALLLAALFFLRMKSAAEPLLALPVIRGPVVPFGIVAASLGMGGFVGLVVHVPLYFERVLGLSASQAGLALIPLMIGTPIGATLSGKTMAWSAHYKRSAMFGLSLALLSVGILAGFGARLPLPAIEVILAVAGLGLGSLFPITTVSVQNAVEAHHMGTVTGALNFTRQLASATAVAVFGAIMLGVAGVAGLAAAEGLPHQVAAADLAALERGYRFVFLAAAVCIALAFVSLVRMEERPLRGAAPPPDVPPPAR